MSPTALGETIHFEHADGRGARLTWNPMLAEWVAQTFTPYQIDHFDARSDAERWLNRQGFWPKKVVA